MSIITRINKAEKRIVDLYNKLKNLPSGGVQSVTGGLVNNTDPSNPVIVDAPSDGTQYARKDGTWEVVSAVESLEKEHDWVSPYSYCGTAPSGSLTSASTWEIKRVEVLPNGSTDIKSASLVKWDDRLTVTYI